MQERRELKEETGDVQTREKKKLLGDSKRRELGRNLVIPVQVGAADLSALTAHSSQQRTRFVLKPGFSVSLTFCTCLSPSGIIVQIFIWLWLLLFGL